MFSELIFLILGFILGGIVTILRATAREAHYEAKIEALEKQNYILWEEAMPKEGKDGEKKSAEVLRD